MARNTRSNASSASSSSYTSNPTSPDQTPVLSFEDKVQIGVEAGTTEEERWRIDFKQLGGRTPHRLLTAAFLNRAAETPEAYHLETDEGVLGEAGVATRRNPFGVPTAICSDKGSPYTVGLVFTRRSDDDSWVPFTLTSNEQDDVKRWKEHLNMLSAILKDDLRSARLSFQVETFQTMEDVNYMKNIIFSGTLLDWLDQPSLHIDAVRKYRMQLKREATQMGTLTLPNNAGITKLAAKTPTLPRASNAATHPWTIDQVDIAVVALKKYNAENATAIAHSEMFHTSDTGMCSTLVAKWNQFYPDRKVNTVDELTEGDFITLLKMCTADTCSTKEALISRLNGLPKLHLKTNQLTSRQVGTEFLQPMIQLLQQNNHLRPSVDDKSLIKVAQNQLKNQCPVKPLQRH